jgi:hypothetical protein
MLLLPATLPPPPSAAIISTAATSLALVQGFESKNEQNTRSPEYECASTADRAKDSGGENSS